MTARMADDPMGCSSATSQPKLRIPEPIWQVMIDHARLSAPMECCGLLAGRDDLACEIYPLTNEAQSTTRYRVEAGLFAPFRRMRELGQELLAIYHSHPTSPATPSRTDLEENLYPQTIHIVVSLLNEPPTVRGYRLFADHFDAVVLEVI